MNEESVRTKALAVCAACFLVGWGLLFCDIHDRYTLLIVGVLWYLKWSDKEAA